MGGDPGGGRAAGQLGGGLLPGGGPLGGPGRPGGGGRTGGGAPNGGASFGAGEGGAQISEEDYVRVWENYARMTGDAFDPHVVRGWYQQYRRSLGR